MRAEHINPFLRSVVDTFDKVLNCKVKRGEITLARQGGRDYPVSGVIGLTGKAVGTVVINLSEDVAIKAAATMLMTEIDELNAEVVDAVGELANMVAGQAKADLAEYDMSVSLPNVITGEGHDIRFPSNTQPITVPFETDFGPLQLVVGLEPVCEPASA